MTSEIKNGETILFIGDSVTDCDRLGSEATLGNGYVKLFSAMLATREPRKRIAVINKGISGNLVLCLRDRWTDDVICNEPDWLVIAVGINDLRSTLNLLGHTDRKSPPEVFREAYDDILSRTCSALPKCRVLLVDPFLITLDRASSSLDGTMLGLLPGYVKVVHNMSRKYGARLVPAHAIFQKLLKYQEPGLFCSEPIHPSPAGHLVIAEAVYEALSKETSK